MTRVVSPHRGMPKKNTGKKVVIYTAISNGYDTLKKPEYISPEYDYVCFTDTPVENPYCWEIRAFDYINADTVRTARYVKVHPHLYFSEYEWSIWVDAHICIIGDLAEIVKVIEKNCKIGTFKHYERDCIYEEAKCVVAWNMELEEVAGHQIERYRNEGYPAHNGLSETGVMVRRHNDHEIINLMNRWWREIDNGSRRDQLSLNYAAFKNSVKIGCIAADGINVRNDPRFKFFKHGGKSTYMPPSPDEGSMGISDEKPGSRALSSAAPAVNRKRSESLSVDIVICVHNSLDDVKVCLASVDATRLSGHRLIVVDDGSDAETKKFLEHYVSSRPDDILVRHEMAKGYTKAANAGLRNSTADYVIMLNSDTIVTGDWILRLLECGESSSDIGIVGPMSNAASWQSVPDILTPDGALAVNDIPVGFSVSDMARLVEFWSLDVFPRVPLLNGFCLAIKRAVVEKVGLFDEDSFPDGYGEEDDYCFRTTDAGFALAVATHTYVFHAKSKSYSPERRRELTAKSRVAFMGKYRAKRVKNAIETMRDHPYLMSIREGIKNFLMPVSGIKPERLSVLYIMPGDSGGAVHPALQEARGIKRLGEDVMVAVEEKHIPIYRQECPFLPPSTFIAYKNEEDLIVKASPFNVIVPTTNSSIALVRKIMSVRGYSGKELSLRATKLKSTKEKILALEKSLSLAEGQSKKSIKEKLHKQYWKYYKAGKKCEVDGQELKATLRKALSMRPLHYKTVKFLYRMMFG